MRRQVCILFNRFKRDPITSGKLSVYEMVSTESTRNTVEISILWDYIKFVNVLNSNPPELPGLLGYGDYIES